jgi:hypothetical protein
MSDIKPGDRLVDTRPQGRRSKAPQVVTAVECLGNPRGSGSEVWTVADWPSGKMCPGIILLGPGLDRWRPLPREQQV